MSELVKTPAPPPHRALPGTILVAEDSDTNRLIIRLMLERGGYTPLLASDGEMAVEMAVRHRPEVVLMDISMPRLDGIAAAREIRRLMPGDTPFLVAVTAAVTHEQRTACRAEGFVSYIEKPIDADELLGVVDYLLDCAAGIEADDAQAACRAL